MKLEVYIIVIYFPKMDRFKIEKMFLSLEQAIKEKEKIEKDLKALGLDAIVKVVKNEFSFSIGE